MDIVNELSHIYLTNDYYSRSLTEVEIKKYYSLMLGLGRVHVLLDTCNIIGFIESWRLTPEQLGRMLCSTNFSALDENVTDGEVLWISDIWIRDYKRQGELLPKLISKLLSTNRDAKFGGSQRTKGRIKLYDKDTWFKHYGIELNKENQHGFRQKDQ